MRWSILLVLIFGYLLSTSSAGLRKINKNDHNALLAEMFRDEMISFYHTKKETPLYSALLKIFEVPNELKRIDGPDAPVPRNDIMCTLCMTVLDTYMGEIRNGATAQEMTDLVVELCNALAIQPPRVCQGLVELNVDTFMFIVNGRPNLQANQMCGLIFQNLDCGDADMSGFEYSINVNPNTPPLTGSKDTSVAPGPNDIRIVHITDPHYDPNYRVGANAVCGEPVCCRYDQPLTGESLPGDAAGRWGDYRDCDSPFDAIADAFTQIRRQHTNFDYVYFTGDIVDHGVWNTAINTNEQSITAINNLLHDTFVGIPVYPVLGNHESHPVNLFAPNSVPAQFSTQWLYTFIAQEWSKWLPESALTTVRIGGYYTVLARPGFRIITINNNDCYTYNWWLMYAPSFPATQLQWLHDTLLAAETANEKVHILGHVPSGEGSCHRVYAREYRRIVGRFWNTISATFGGHTHADEFNIFYSLTNPSQALNVMWNGGSTTAYSDVNPNYRLYTADPTTYQINTHETWIYNLTLANLNPNQNPTWYKEYDFISEYGVTNLSPASLSTLAGQFAGDRNKLHRYWQLKQKLGDTSLATGCDDECLSSHLCEMVTTEHGNSPRCDELLAIFWGTK